MRHQKLLSEIDEEIEKAVSMFPEFNSLHEGYAVLLEEIDELWSDVKTKQQFRNTESIHQECIQIAAMACRIIIDCGKENYRL